VHNDIGVRSSERQLRCDADVNPSQGCRSGATPDCRTPRFEQPAITTPASRLALASFGRAVLGLLDCNKCFVSIVGGDADYPAQTVHIGLNGGAEPTIHAITQLTRWDELKNATVQPFNSDHAMATALLGREPSDPCNALAGRFSAYQGCDLIFLAGWRAFPFEPMEIACLKRATRMLWATAKGLNDGGQSDVMLEPILEELTFPAFAVDGGLRLLEANEMGRQFLLKCDPLRLDRGVLTSTSIPTANRLRSAVRDILASRPDRNWSNTIVPLSTDRRAFVFAWIGVAPTEARGDRLLVVVPQVDHSGGAKRIASVFGLNEIQERIVADVLRGQSPSRIGRHVGLTEGTVRTYTKRIMLKLGIHRQTEFFLLYILTMSPFGSVQRTPDDVDPSDLDASTRIS
jgi:DNA-binding CsgD family transcriptional regulator